MDTSPLKEAGLTDGEIKTYLALLEIGLSTSGPIIEKSRVARSIIYQILDRLMQKGLVSYIIKEKTKYYQAAAPHKIFDYLEEKEKKVRKNKSQIQKIMPDLLLKQTQSIKSQATIYMGIKGLHTAHEQTYLKLRKSEEYCYLGIPAYQPPEQHAYWKKDHKRRAKAGIMCRLLFNNSTDKSIIKDRNRYEGCKARLMGDDIETPASFVTFKDTTLIIIQSPEPFAFEIENQQVANSFQAYFEVFWKRSKT